MTVATPGDGCAIVQRGCCLGAAWGTVIGICILALLAVADTSSTALAFLPVAAAIGAGIGAVAGTVTGMALGLAEQLWVATDCRRRAVGSCASALASPFCILWLSGDLAAGAFAALLVVGGLGAVAGALLAPRAVKGRQPRE